MEEINSREYWENRFSTESWEKCSGREQSVYFAKVAVDHFPEWFVSELSQNEWELRDYGCAQGDGTAFIAQHFPSCTVTGIDISEEAVKKAAERYPYCEFVSGNMENEIDESDIIFSSNTLEHMKNPKKILKELVKNARKYAVLLVPLEDQFGIDEHFHVFETSFFPMHIGEHSLCCMRIVDCRNTDKENIYWRGKQALVIYVNTAYKNLTDELLTDFYKTNVFPLQEERGALLEQIAQQKELFAKAREEADAAREAWREELEQERQNAQNTREDLIKKHETQQQTIQKLMEEKEQLQSCADRLRESEQQLQNSRERVQVCEHQLQDSQEHMQEYRQQLQTSQEHMQEYRQQLQATQDRVKTYEHQLQACQERMQKYEQQLQASQERMQEYEQQLQAGDKRMLEYQDQLHADEQRMLLYQKQLQADREQADEQEAQLHIIKKRMEEYEEQRKVNEELLKERDGQLSLIEKQAEEYKKQIHDSEVLALERETQLCTGRIVAAEYEQEVNQGKQTIEEQKKALMLYTNKIEEQKRHLSIIQERIAQIEENITSLEYWLQVAGKSEPMKLAHFFVQLKHALFGKSEERKECWRWLKGDRSFVPKYSFIRQSAVQAAELHAKVCAAREIAENARSISPLEIASYYANTADAGASSGMLSGLREFAKIIEAYQGKTVIVLPELVDWNIPLFQRPQQLAMSFAEMGILFVYFTPNGNDNVHSVKKLMDNCVLLPPEWFDQVLTILTQRNLDVVLDIWSTDNKHFMPWIDRYRDMGCRILYEYIDEISDDITGKVPRGTFERHHELLEDTDVSVVATADKLYNDVIRIRGCEQNCLNSGNGVDLKHFRVKTDDTKIPISVKSIIRTKKPIIGYFGAIANWFDFEMVEYAARHRKNYEFMMIGPHYGTHDLTCLERMKEIKNLHFVGTIEYQKLPHVASHFTVATIPFKLNEITESTSPIKLFEYMAMGKPIVTTAMRECFKYPVVRIAKSKEDYVVALDEAVKKAGDEQFLKDIAEVAERNSWLRKAQEICELLGISE